MKSSDTTSGTDPEVEEADIRDITGEAVVEHEVQKKNRSGSPALTFVLALVAVLVTLGGLTLGYLHWSRLEASFQHLNQVVLEANQRTLALSEELAGVRSTFEEQQALVLSHRQTLEQQTLLLQEERDKLLKEGEEIQRALQVVNSRIGSNGSDWMLSEAEYLLTLANYRLTLERDPATALLALEAADERLRMTGNPEWDEMRELLQVEISQLQEVESADRDALVQRIVKLSSQVGLLNIRGRDNKSMHIAKSPNSTAKPENRTMETLVRDGWEGFKSIMVIKRHNQPVEMSLPPQQQLFILENIRLQLAAAQLSLLYDNQSLYDSSLESVAQWLAAHFDQEDAQNSAFLAEINQLRGIQIARTLPDMTSTLEVMRERLELVREQSISQ